MSAQRQILYLSHGGGPLPLLGDPGHSELVEQLQRMATDFIQRPSAILVISAHWEEEQPTIGAVASPDLIYDYSGFPAESYQISYPAQGEPALAEKLSAALQEAGISVQHDAHRGFDHGVFVPLKLMYPDADIPVLQLSLVKSLDAQQHLRIGQALKLLEYDNLLIVGSGFSFHNMRAFFSRDNPEQNTQSQAFEGWLKATLCDPGLSEAERYQRLAQWQQAPHARFCHPREEHLLPLHVCYGAAGRASDLYQSAQVLGKTAGLFYWRD